MSRDPRPKPGSDDAMDIGCICDQRDNNHGRYAPFPPDGWYVTEGCPLHDPDSGVVGGIPVSGPDV